MPRWSVAAIPFHGKCSTKMIRIHLCKYDWVVTFYFSVSTHEFLPVMRHLWMVGCRDDDFVSAWNNVNKGCCNRGLTYSSYSGKESVVVVGEASSFGELMNSLSHEIHHLSVHIAQAFGLDLAGEEVCYIDGEVTQRVFEAISSGRACSMPTTSCASSPWSEERGTGYSCRQGCSRTIR